MRKQRGDDWPRDTQLPEQHSGLQLRLVAVSDLLLRVCLRPTGLWPVSVLLGSMEEHSLGLELWVYNNDCELKDGPDCRTLSIHFGDHPMFFQWNGKANEHMVSLVSCALRKWK